VLVERTSVGLDVHARSVAAAAIDGVSGERRQARLSPSHDHIRSWIGELAGPVAVTYEAGPTGFGLYRALTAEGVRCVVAAPSKLQRPSGDRVKTDAKDAVHLARLLRLGEVTSVAVPTVDQESARDLVRARKDCLAPAGSEGAGILRSYEQAMGAQDIGYERLDTDGVSARWPQFRLAADLEALFQPDGGILDIRRACAANLALAGDRGAAVVPDARVYAIEETAHGVRLTSTAGKVEAERVVVCCGAWTARLLERALGIRWPIQLTHEQVTYLSTPQPEAFTPDRFPIWIWHDTEEFYGFPVYGEQATKAAKEICGDPVDIDRWDWQPDLARVERVQEFVERILPGHERIAVCIGAGHAANFASLLGRVLAELTLDGGTDVPVKAFRADRPALVDADYVPAYRFGAASPTGGT
jgi:glycine/D-amino acid oxidase-like deaminating enzyme